MSGDELWLTEADIQALDAAVAKVFEQDPVPTFLSLVDAYCEFVASLEGYAFSIYDYDNDLALRDNLDLVLAFVDAPLRDKALVVLRSADEAFETQTVETVRRHGSGSPRSMRLPIRPGDELASDIESGNV